jgi:hypothetical protein
VYTPAVQRIARCIAHRRSAVGLGRVKTQARIATKGAWQRDVEASCQAVIQASKPEPRIMRYELADHEWATIKPMLH